MATFSRQQTENAITKTDNTISGWTTSETNKDGIRRIKHAAAGEEIDSALLPFILIVINC